ncbi:MAG: response regulator [Spirochaetales bacterium]|nr:response regulator [Spirochaetales bacterium]
MSTFIKETEAQRYFNLVILDLIAPGKLGGKETAREIRKLDDKIPIFVASGYANGPVLANPNEYGLTAGIRKPFRKAELEAFLSRHLKNMSAG